MNNKNIGLIAATSVALLAGCATTVQKPTTMTNPAPEMAFSKFTSFELKPINTTESCNKQEGGDQALTAIQEKLNVRLGALLSGWNTTKTVGHAGHKLVVEPVCTDVKLVGGAARFWGGALAGSSAVVMKVRYVDLATGKKIAEPVFYQRASAMGAAWSFGATDRNMADRMAELITDYTSKNYQVAVGGATGLQPE
jgi:hypothetical protein